MCTFVVATTKLQSNNKNNNWNNNNNKMIDLLITEQKMYVTTKLHINKSNGTICKELLFSSDI